MKKIIIILTIIIGLTTSQQVLSQVGVSVDINTFNTALSPYGRWIDYPQYGRIWICNEPGFRPYYNDGHWEYTEDGWTWISDYPWGWAPFHYGRWAFTNAYGWGWVPGYDWAPAWVSWSNSGDYYGWAPLSPGLGLYVSIGSIPAARWCFVPHQYINSPSLHNYYVDNSRNASIYKNVRFINNTHASNNVRYTAGPSRTDVERTAHIKIQTRSINYSQTPGRTVVTNNAVNIYRPSIRKNTAATPSNLKRNVANSNTTTNHSNTNKPARTNSSQNNINRNQQSQNNQHSQQQALQQRQQRINTQQQRQPNVRTQQQQPPQRQQVQQVQRQPQERQMPQRMNRPAQNNRTQPAGMPAARGNQGERNDQQRGRQ